MSPSVGARLAFDESAQPDVGSMIVVSYGPDSALDEVEHADVVSGEHRVGVLWLNG